MSVLSVGAVMFFVMENMMFFVMENMMFAFQAIGYGELCVIEVDGRRHSAGA